MSPEPLWRASCGAGVLRAALIGCTHAPGCGQLVGRRLVFLRAVGGHRLVRLARIDETGRVRFDVPHVAPGRYRLVASEDGRARHVSSWFRVTRRR